MSASDRPPERRVSASSTHAAPSRPHGGATAERSSPTGATGGPLTAIVPDTLAGERLDLVAARLFPMHSRGRLQGWIAAGRLTVDGRERRARDRLLGGETLRLSGVGDGGEVVGGRRGGGGPLRDDPTATATATATATGTGAEADTASTPADEALWSTAPAEPLPLVLAHEDASILVVDKPAGLVMHPAPGHPSGTLVNALLHHDPALRAVPRAGVVHRLDKDTSGLCVVARTLVAHTHLVRQLQARTMGREYLAVALGDPPGKGAVDAPIARHPKDRKRMAVVAGGRHAITRYRVLERFAGCALLALRLETGRTHQIRVHMNHVGHPLLGDPVYGRRRATLPAALAREPAVVAFARQALHARRLTLVHPESGETFTFESPPPADLAALLAALRGERGSDGADRSGAGGRPGKRAGQGAAGRDPDASGRGTEEGEEAVARERPERSP